MSPPALHLRAPAPFKKANPPNRSASTRGQSGDFFSPSASRVTRLPDRSSAEGHLLIGPHPLIGPDASTLIVKGEKHAPLSDEQRGGPPSNRPPCHTASIARRGSRRSAPARLSPQSSRLPTRTPS